MQETQITLRQASENAEKELLIKTLEECKFNKSKVARQLGIDRKTLYTRAKKYNIEIS